MASAGRIKQKFREMRARGEAALVPFIVAGDPDLDTTRRLILELEKRGADLIEIGVPFSDPMADGPANQRSLARGLGAGASIAAILSMVSEIRAPTDANNCAQTPRAPASMRSWWWTCRWRKLAN